MLKSVSVWMARQRQLSAASRERFHRQWLDCCEADGKASTRLRWLAAATYGVVANISASLLFLCLLFSQIDQSNFPFLFRFAAGLFVAMTSIEPSLWPPLLLGPICFGVRSGHTAIRARWSFVENQRSRDAQALHRGSPL